MRPLTEAAARAEADGDHAGAVAHYDAALAQAREAAQVRELHLRRLTAIRAGGLGAADPRADAVLAAVAGDLGSEIDARLLLARIAATRGRFALAIARAGEVHARAPLLDDPLAAAYARAEAHRVAGLARVSLGQPAAARAELDAAVAEAREAGEDAALADALNDRGLALGYAGEHAAAVADHAAALALLETAPAGAAVARARAATRNNLGFAEWSRGRYAQASDHLGQALAERQRLGDRHGEAVTRNNLGNVHRHLGDLPRARAEYEAALELARRSGGALQEAITGNNLGQLAEEHGDLAGAERRYREALRRATDLGDRIREGDNLGNLGACLVRRGVAREGAAWLRRAVALRGEIGDRAYQVLDLSWLALAEQALGEPATARATLVEALAGVEGSGAEQVQTVYLNAFRVLRESEPARARELLLRARDVVEAGSAALPEGAARVAFREHVRVNREILEHVAAEQLLDAAPVPVRAAPVAETRAETLIVGRDRERDTLGAALAAAASSQGGLALITGEPGIGKTQLCTALDERARAEGFATLWARGGERFERHAGLWGQVMQAALRESADPDGLLATMAPAAVDLTSFSIPLWLGETVVAFLRAASAARPLLVLLDDLHLEDAGSIQILQHVAREVRYLPVLVVGTYREVEARADEAVARVFAALGKGATRLPLRGLREGDLVALVPAWLGDVELPMSFVALLHQRSGGNPLFARELAHELALRAAASGSLQSTIDLPIAPSVNDAVAGRIARVSPAARSVLEAAAVIGRGFELPLVARLTGWQEAGCLAAMEEGLRTGLVTAGGGPELFAFTSSMVRTVLYRDIPDERRATLHLAFARAVEDAWTAGPEPRHAELARHFALAARAGGRVPALRHHHLAGERAAAQGAFADGRRHLRHALALMEPGDDPGRRCEILVVLAEMQAALDDAGAGATFAEAAALAGELGRPALLARVALGSGRASPALALARVATARTALERLGDAEPALRARLLGRLATTCGGGLTDEEREDVGAQAVALARTVGDVALVAQVLGDTLEGLTSAFNLEARLRGAAELESAGAVGRAARLRTTALVELGDRSGAEAALAVATRAAREARDARAVWLAAVHAAMLAALRGRADDAERLAGEARALGERAGLRDEAHDAWRLLLWRLRRAQGRLGELVPELAARLAADPDADVWRVALGQARLAAGDRAGARELVAALLLGRGRGRARDADWLGFLVALAELAAALAEARPLRRILDALAPFEARTALLGEGAASLGPVAAVLARAEPSPAAVPQAQHAPVALVREENLWRVTWGTRVVWVRDCRGLAYLDELLRAPGCEVHVGRLVHSSAPDELPVLGDAGEMLDARARAAYRSRLEALEAEATPTAETRAEIAFLTGELARAVGLGGRERRAGSQQERMRQSVTKRLREAVSRVGAEDAELGRYLGRCLTTGTFCSYDPARVTGGT